ncbi:hypothetical protein ACIUZJ_15475 [Pseudomonas aeruginosa]|uniref:hypothetical protein n=1 Tax=Pseudomonas aeruginosa TaxID=287 RepID=UPI0006892B09|nr:hypothetical protein [Pseudomonas aeruginosa]NRS71927.1 hypothetical protein [Pseudomonas aeruginosa]PHI26110.1 hypothetical protein CRX60_03450 [Pseudomonas aeruginosa]HBP0834738.1 hypothetical protein [Pseudomonas aeruginosa]HCF3806998.1 hypothetical protein [Pseudomonas aeruginosa]HCT2495814.1 hypothetical protein [Pseudomonas aeruginosa]
MTIELNTKAIRGLTRLALPADDGYIYRLGGVLYGFASLSSFLSEVAHHLDPLVNRTVLQAKTGGDILSEFRKSVKKAKASKPAVGPIGRAAADMFEALNTRRSDIVHAYPITNNATQQILHRRLDEKNRYFEVTNELLDEFISKLHDVSSKLYEVRAIMKPELGD